MTHYACLGLQPSATLDEIKDAYRKLVRGAHPDKVPAQKERFLAIQAAYETLRDPNKRKAYDESLIMGLDEASYPRKSFPLRRKYRLITEPYALNHYQFTNTLFMVEQGDEEYLTPGRPISKWDKNRLWHQLHEVAGRLHAERQRLKRKVRKTKADIKRLDLLTLNENKIGQVMCILTAGEKEKLLYDLSLGQDIVEQLPQLLEILQLIGGQERLLNHLKVHPELWTARSIFALREVDCLNPVNFDRLTASGNGFIDFADISHLIMELFETNFLNQKNFDLALTHRKHASTLFKGMLNLRFAGLLNQTSFENLVQCGKNAETAGSALRTLKKYNLLNHANWQMVLHMAGKDIDFLLVRALSKLEEQTLLASEDGLTLQWTDDREDLRQLCQCVDDMFAYGISLLCWDIDKAITVFLLAINLKKSLKTFFERPVEEQVAQQQQFRAEFLRLLHSEDTNLAEHRAYWKVIVANIAIAFTGIGLLALGAHYLHSGHCFFHQTYREKLRDAIEESRWLQEEPLIKQGDLMIGR